MDDDDVVPISNRRVYIVLAIISLLLIIFLALHFSEEIFGMEISLMNEDGEKVCC